MTSVDRFPVFVAFKDEKDSRTIFEVDRNDLAATFGPGVRFIGLEIEITDAPLTKKIVQRLPWLADTSKKIGLEPPGGTIPMTKWSVGQFVIHGSFLNSQRFY